MRVSTEDAGIREFGAFRVDQGVSVEGLGFRV